MNKMYYLYLGNNYWIFFAKSHTRVRMSITFCILRIKTIQKETSTLVAGDTVFIKIGKYNEHVSVTNSGTANNYIVFLTYPEDELNVIITSVNLPNKEFGIIGKSYIKVTGLRRKRVKRGSRIEGPIFCIILDGYYTYGTSSTGISGWGVPWLCDLGNYDNIQNIIVTNNSVEKSCERGGDECIAFANGVVNFQITNNLVKNGDNPINGSEGIDLKEGGSNGIIVHNVVYNLTRRAIYLYVRRNNASTPWGKPIILNIDIFDNLIPDQHAEESIVIMNEGPGNVQYINIYNNLIFNNPQDCIMYYKYPYSIDILHNITAKNNTIYNNGCHGILSNIMHKNFRYIKNNLTPTIKMYFLL